MSHTRAINPRFHYGFAKWLNLTQCKLTRWIILQKARYHATHSMLREVSVSSFHLSVFVIEN